MRFLIKYSDVLKYQHSNKEFEPFAELKSAVNNIFVLMDDKAYISDSISHWRKEIKNAEKSLKRIGFPYSCVILQRDALENIVSRNHIDYILSFDGKMQECFKDKYVELVDINQDAKALRNQITSIVEYNFSPIICGDISITDAPSKNKIWLKNYNRRAQRDLERFSEEHKSIFQHICDNNKDFLYQTAIEYYGVKITYMDLIKNVEINERVLSYLGVRKGDVVTVCTPNVPSAIYLYFAAQEIGAIPSMMHVYSSPEEMKYYLNTEKSRFVVMIGLNRVKKNLQSILNDTPVEKVIVIPLNDSLDCSCPEAIKTKLGLALLGTELGSRLFKNENAKFDMPLDDRFVTHRECIEKSRNTEINRAYNDISTIIHTGGTTGMGKSTLLTHDNINRNDDAFEATIQDFERGDAIIAIPPLFHVLGLNNCIILILRAGGKVILVSKYQKVALPRLIQKYKPAFLFGVPKIGRDILEVKEFENTDLSCLKYYVLGGEEMSQQFLEKTMDFLEAHNARIKVSQSLGATEGACSLTNTFEPNILGSLGIPLINMDMKIIKKNQNEEIVECRYGERGEICFSGPSIMKGYLNAPEENETVLREHDDGKIWFHTGDLGYVDKNGVLFFVNRIKDMLKINGEQVYPSNIKKIIMQHKAVKDCAVVGTEDSHNHKRVAAIIVLHNPMDDIEQIKREIMTVCAENLTRESIPSYIEVCDKLPETKLFKVDNIQICKSLQRMKKVPLVVGVDADDTLTDLLRLNKDYGEKFDFIQKLNSDGIELHEITTKKFVSNVKWKLQYRKRQFERWLNNYGIKFKTIQYCSERFSLRDKLLACHKLKVDIMIEDKVDVALYLAKEGIQVLLFDTPYNKDMYNENIRRVEDWKEVCEVLEHYRDKKLHTPLYEYSETVEIKTLAKEQKIDYLKSNRANLLKTDCKKSAKVMQKRFQLLYWLGRLPLWLMFRPSIVGRDNIPFQDGLLIVSNHLDNYDQFLIASALRGKPFTGLAASTIKQTLRGRIFSWLGVTFVDRESKESGRKAQKELALKLLNGMNCLIFPEGTRKNKYSQYKDIQLLNFKYGAVSIAQKTGAPILPIAIRYGKGFTERTMVRIGAPVIIKYEDDVVEKTEFLREKILALLDE